jgi:hypothetical protein
MDFRADQPLSPAEFASLKEVSFELMAKRIPIEHSDKLIEMGLIEQKLGGLMLTNEGKMRLALGK